MLYPVILSGGIGTRLWPVSSQNHPKQFKSLLGDKTLLQSTYQRVLSGFDSKDVFLVIKEDMTDMVKEQIDIKDKNIFAEPQGKGTAMAIGLAALKLSQQDSEANLVIVNSDAHVKETDKYIEAIKKAGQAVDKYPDKFILIGVKPNYPATGLGYIELGDSQGDDIFVAKSFTEKPDKQTAEQYIKSGKYLWNPALFVFKASQLLEWYKEHLPKTYQALMEISESHKDINKAYEKVENISIDYGLLEKLDSMLVLPTDMTWADIGTWRSLRDIQLNGEKPNVSNTKTASLDSKNNLFYSFNNKLIAAVGVEDMVLVETDDVILLCPADKTQDVKKLLEEIKGSDLEKYL